MADDPEMIPDPPSWSELHRVAMEEVLRVQGELPPDLRIHVRTVPVLYAPFVSQELVEDGLEPDLLGLFLGDSVEVPEWERQPVPRQILLFLEAIWYFSEGDLEGYRREVRITYIHEFGHYLGLDEEELDERGLL